MFVLGIVASLFDLKADRDVLEADRDGLEADRDDLEADRDGLEADRNLLEADRDLLEADRDHSQLMTRTQKLVNSELTPNPNQKLRDGPSPFVIDGLRVTVSGDV